MHKYWREYAEMHSLELEDCSHVCGFDECKYYYGECPNSVGDEDGSRV